MYGFCDICGWFSGLLSVSMLFKVPVRFFTPRVLPQLMNSSKSACLTWHFPWYINSKRLLKWPDWMSGKYRNNFSHFSGLRRILFNLVVAYERITLWALNCFPSPEARVTSEKSSSFQRFLMSSEEFASKSFQETQRVSSSMLPLGLFKFVNSTKSSRDG